MRRNSSKKVLSKQDQVQSGRSAWGADTKKTSPAKLCSKEKRSGIGPLVAAPMQSRMVSLGKDRELKQDAVKLPTGKSPEDWVKAKEFVPGQVYGGTGNAHSCILLSSVGAKMLQEIFLKFVL